MARGDWLSETACFNEGLRMDKNALFYSAFPEIGQSSFRKFPEKDA